MCRRQAAGIEPGRRTLHRASAGHGHRLISLIKSFNNLLIETNDGLFFRLLQKVCYTSESTFFAF